MIHIVGNDDDFEDCDNVTMIKLSEKSIACVNYDYEKENFMKKNIICE
jgi:hypothetical protein